ncbi:heme biosynthesis HemY N-terminal domain-containing protein [Glaciecola siphonariae]|uniref:Heme biosynthesis HemY N-terminal domain-containing protein n=1 Tax=Glaciecola siphonariae TaxID=521012 RepID=A0ABV9LXB4_9ALTE
MIKLIILLVVLFFALMFGHTLVGQEGMVIIALPDTVIELSIISAMIVAFFTIVGFWILTYFVKRVIRLLIGSRTWLGSFSNRQQNKAFHEALQAYLTGDFTQATAQLKKSFGGDFSGSNYMLAADIDARVNEGKNVEALLAKAQVDSSTSAAALLKQAQLALIDQQPQKAIEALDQLSEKQRKQPTAVQLRLQTLAKLERWAELKDVAYANKKAMLDDHLVWTQRATHGEFAEIASKQGANALKEKWQNLSRSARKDVGNQACYIQLLLDQGLSNDAETALVEFAKKQEHEAYWGLFKQLEHGSPAKAIRFIEHKIKQQPERAVLYSVLAHLAYNSADYSLAKRAINKAIELERSAADLLLLADILEKEQSFEQANQLYKSLVNAR